MPRGWVPAERRFLIFSDVYLPGAIQCYEGHNRTPFGSMFFQHLEKDPCKAVEWMETLVKLYYNFL